MLCPCLQRVLGAHAGLLGWGRGAGKHHSFACNWGSAAERPWNLSGVWQPVMRMERRGEKGLAEEGSGNKDCRMTIEEDRKALRV